MAITFSRAPKPARTVVGKVPWAHARLSWHAGPMNPAFPDGWRPTVLVHLRIRVALDRQAELRAFFREAIPFYGAPGGIRVSLLSKDADPECFIEQIEYADERTCQEDDERTRSDSTMGQYLARWRSMLAEAPIVEVYREALLDHQPGSSRPETPSWP